jgi:hypothetical protein
MAWSVDMEYKVPGEEKFWVTTRPIHKLIIAVTIKEQTFNYALENEAEEETIGRVSPKNMQE